MKDRSLLLRLELQSNPELLCVVRGALDRLTQEMGFPEPQCRSVTRAVDEAMTNIIRHAYRDQRDQPIELICYRSQRLVNGEPEDGLEIVLKDQGAPADPTKMRGRPLEEVRPGGLGLHYIRESTDVMEFSRSVGTNELRLVKYLPPRTSNQGC